MQNRRILKNAPLLFVIVLVLLGAGVLLYTQRKSDNSSNGKIKVTTSFYPMYYFASEIGGDKAQVTNITPAGAEPHDYEPTALEIARMHNSDILILNGGVEPWADKVKDDLSANGTVIITAGKDLLTKEITEDGEKMKDPHVWLSPVLAKEEVEKILEGYKQADAENSAYYEENAASLKTRLDKLDNDYKSGLQSCKKKDIITSHEAFAYLASEYSLNQVAIVGVSADEEPSSKKLAEVADFVKTNGIKYIFFETLLSPKYSQTIASETGAQTLVLDPIEGISDEDAKGGKNYFTIMQENLTNLELALGCEQ